MKEIAGEVAGKIWNALNENEGQDLKALKKSTKETDRNLYLTMFCCRNLYLGLGWLLREDKIYGENGKFNLK